MLVRRSFTSLVFVTLLTTVSWANENARSGSWPQWRGPQRDGLSTETGLNTNWQQHPPKLLWMSEGLGNGYASVSMDDGRLYTTGNLPQGQSVIAVDASSGSLQWKTNVTAENPRHSYEGSRSTPTLDGDRLYIVSSDGQIVCLNTADGQIRWQKSFRKEWNGKLMSGWGFSESPLVDGDWVLCTPGGTDAMIVALNKLTGEEVWRAAVPALGNKGRDGAGYSSIVVSNGAGVKQYVQLVGRGVIGVRAADGKFLWGYNDVANSTANIPTPLAMGDYIFCSTGYQTGAALLKLSADGEGVKAEEEYFLDAAKLQNHHGGMLLVGDYVYCGHKHREGFPICVRLADGQVAWGGDFRGPGKGSAGIVYADGHIVFRYEDGTVALIEATPDEYCLKGTFTPEYQEGKSWAHPVIVGGRLYLREQDKLMCYDLTAAN